MDKMKVMGLRRQKNYSGRWDVLIQQATQCLNRLIEIAARKRRNYILDQTNVYGSARRRKMRPFEGFQRKAIVICPTDEDLKERTLKQTNEQGKDVPDHAVLEMKANFTVPEACDFLEDVTFAAAATAAGTEAADTGNTRGSYIQNRWGNRESSSDARSSYNRSQPATGSYNRPVPYNKGTYSQGYSQSYNQGYNQGSYNQSYYSQYPGYSQSYSQIPTTYAQQWQQYYQNQNQWNQYYSQYGGYPGQAARLLRLPVAPPCICPASTRVLNTLTSAAKWILYSPTNRVPKHLSSFHQSVYT
ncbi:hypothetical protein KUCAC02_005152 [Chaenocephalus aceratus]|uniref:Uncharacterized protein n=1 Tax=Chaenocephalus aceratus TaxID=36190 RepID=A0ACB9WNL6_CHAAC|nr:hypothetical protein KUCAC02_005152 [Chaenocephalus aceratus]